MKQSLIAIYVAISLVVMGCFVSREPETPERRFQIFVSSILDGNRASVEDCLLEDSMEFLRRDMARLSLDGDWLTRLIKDTRAAGPVYLRSEWIDRNTRSRIHYSIKTGDEDSLVLVYRKERWYIDLAASQPPEISDLPVFKVTKN